MSRLLCRTTEPLQGFFPVDDVAVREATSVSSCSGDPTSVYTRAEQARWSALLCRQNNQAVDNIRGESIAYRGHCERCRRVHWSELPEKRLLETLRPRWKILLRMTHENTGREYLDGIDLVRHRIYWQTFSESDNKLCTFSRNQKCLELKDWKTIYIYVIHYSFSIFNSKLKKLYIYIDFQFWIKNLKTKQKSIIYYFSILYSTFKNKTKNYYILFFFNFE